MQLANTISKVHNAIVEYEKGYFVQRDFSAKKFSKQYTKYLETLQRWHTYTSVEKSTRTAEKVRRELYAAARYVTHFTCMLRL